jgi:hypothetical protein
MSRASGGSSALHQQDSTRRRTFGSSAGRESLHARGSVPSAELAVVPAVLRAKRLRVHEGVGAENERSVKRGPLCGLSSRSRAHDDREGTSGRSEDVNPETRRRWRRRYRTGRRGVGLDPLLKNRVADRYRGFAGVDHVSRPSGRWCCWWDAVGRGLPRFAAFRTMASRKFSRNLGSRSTNPLPSTITFLAWLSRTFSNSDRLS